MASTETEAEAEYEWRPAKFLVDHGGSSDFALLVLNQPLRNNINLRRLWRNLGHDGWDHEASLRVAADGGANRLYQLSSFQGKFSKVHAIVGDLDSLHPNVREFYESQREPAKIIHDTDQESTDFSKAIAYIRDTASPGIDIVALGGIGGRVDQGISQLHHLYIFQPGVGYPHGRIFFMSASSLTFLLKVGTHRIQVREDESDEDVFGMDVGIIPLKEPARISTKGLQWDITEWETSMGGRISTSNHILQETKVVEIKTNKDVLFTIALCQTDGEEDTS